MKIILGSSSKFRKSVLEVAGYDFETMSPDIDEKAIRSDDFYQLPAFLARAKADALRGRIKEPAIVITADQVVVCNGNLYEKPQDAAEAKSFLQTYSNGFPAETVSAVFVMNTENGKEAEGVDIAKTFFKPIPELVMDDFIASGDPFSNAGGFACQSPILDPYIERIEGTEDSVMGMPLDLLEELIAKVR